jgi:DNA mismatch repair ATPase MutL
VVEIYTYTSKVSAVMQWIRKHISRSEDQDKQDPTPPPAAAESGQQMESSRAQNLENPSSNSQEPPASQYNSKDPKLPKGSQNPEMVKTTGPPLQQSIEEENPEKKQPSQDDEDLASVGRQENKEEVVGSDGVLEDKDEEEEQDKAGAVVAAVEEEEDDQGEEECLVSIPGTVVHMVDDEESPHLATGVFSIVRITQNGNGILVLANVGHNLHWPVLKDMPTVKLDPTHYFFSLPLTPVMMDDDEAPHPNGDNNQNEVKRKSFAPSCNRFWCLIY